MFLSGIEVTSRDELHIGASEYFALVRRDARTRCEAKSHTEKTEHESENVILRSQCIEHFCRRGPVTKSRALSTSVL